MVYRFGNFILDTERQQLYKGSQLEPVPRKVYEILQLLVTRSGEIVTKDEILATIWPNKQVEESNLAQHIHMTRRALGDSSRSPRYVMTIPGKGYLFNHRVSVVESDIGQLSREAESELAEQPGGESSTGRLYRRRSLRTLLAIGSLLLAAGTVWSLYHISINIGQSARPAEVLVSKPLVTLPGTERFPALSPDERYVAFSAEGDKTLNQDIYIKDIEYGNLRKITSSEEIDNTPTWSPDGTQLAYLQQTTPFGTRARLMAISLVTGEEREIAVVSGGVDWSPDGRYLAVTDQPEGVMGWTIQLISPDGSERRFAVSLDKSTRVFDTLPRFSPDGKSIAFVRWVGDSTGDIYIVTLADGRIRRLTSDQKRVSDLKWSGDGQEIVFCSNRSGVGRLWRVPVTGGEPLLFSQFRDEVEFFAIGHRRHQLLFTHSLSDSLIEIMPVDIGNQETGVTEGANLPCRVDSSLIDTSPRFAPDGSRIVFVSNRSGWNELWVAKSDCSGERQLTNTRMKNLGSPRWSPDGTRITFDGDLGDHSHIFTIAADGSDQRQITSIPARNILPAWSADGRWIYYTSRLGNERQIYKVPSGGGNPPVQVTTGGGQEPIESTDGRSIYYTKDETLWYKDLNTGAEKAVPEISRIVVGRYWDLTPRGIFFIPHNPGQGPVIWRLDLKTRQKRPIGRMNTSLSRWTAGISVLADEKFIAASGIAYRFGDILITDTWP